MIAPDGNTLPIARAGAGSGFDDDQVIEELISKAGLEAVRAHARAGRDIPLWRDGRVVWVPAKSVLPSEGNSST